MNRSCYDYICPNCGKRFPEEKVAQGFFCCSPQCTRKYLRTHSRWVVSTIVGRFFEGECPRSWPGARQPFASLAPVTAREEKQWEEKREKEFDDNTNAAYENMGILNHTARQWGYRFTHEEHAEIRARHPDCTHPERLERLRMIRDGEGVSCRCCDARVGLYDEICAACGEGL